MTATTPFLTNEDMLGPLASRYVDVGSLPWKPTPCPGIDMKVLLEDKETGLLTALFRWQAGFGTRAPRACRGRADLCPRRQPRGRRGRGHRRQLRLAPQGQPPHREVAERRAGAVGVPQAQHLPPRARRGAAAAINHRSSSRRRPGPIPAMDTGLRRYDKEGGDREEACPKSEGSPLSSPMRSAIFRTGR